MHRESLIDILKPIVEAMVFPIRIYKNDVNGIDYKLHVNNVYHSQIGFEAIIGGNPYTIKEVNYSLNILTVTDETGTTPITVTEFNLYEPYFFHGTPIETGAELMPINDASKKTPMIWVMDGFTDTDDEDAESTTDRISKPRIFFLTQCNFNKVTNQLHDEYERPMRSLKNSFEKAIKNEWALFDTIDWKVDVIAYNKFGVYIQNKGVPDSLFADQLSGIEIQPSFNILKNGDCLTPPTIFLADECDELLLDECNNILTLQF